MTPKHTTDALIRQLAERPAPSPFRAGAVTGTMVALLAAALVLFWMIFGLRADLAQAWSVLQVQAKTVLPVTLSILAFWLALRSSYPGGRVAIWPLGLPVITGLALVVWRLGQAPDDVIYVEFIGRGQTALACMSAVTVLSALPLGAGIWILRQSAPTRPAFTGGLLGLAVGAGIAAGYALYCTEDSPLFFMSWYSLAIGIVAVAGAFLGDRFLRW